MSIVRPWTQWCLHSLLMTGGAYQIAEIYAFRNQPDEVFEWLDRAYAQRDSGLIGTKVEPLLKSLHGDPRFAAILKKLNLANLT